jgi:hypothetical protein
MKEAIMIHRALLVRGNRSASLSPLPWPGPLLDPELLGMPKLDQQDKITQKSDNNPMDSLAPKIEATNTGRRQWLLFIKSINYPLVRRCY